jgi:glycosyltransferase involved in cell wall biosynthesis
MRILIMVEGFGAGGLETHVLGQVAALRGLGHEVLVWAMEQRAPSFAPPETRFAPAVQTADSAREFGVGVHGFAAWLRAERVDLLYAHNLRAAMLAAFAAQETRLPFIVAIHGPYEAGRAVNPLWRAYIDALAFPAASFVAPVSELVAEAVRARGARRVHIVRNGVSDAWCAPAETSRNGRRLLVSRLDARKTAGILPLLEQLRALPALRLDIAGEGERRVQLEQAIAALDLGGRVRLLGLVTEVRPLMSSYDCILGMGRVVLEAAALGKPTVCLGYEGPKGVVDAAFLKRSAAVNHAGVGLPNVPLQTILAALAGMTAGDRDAIRDWVRENAVEGRIWRDADALLRETHWHDWPLTGIFLSECIASQRASVGLRDLRLFRRVLDATREGVPGREVLERIVTTRESAVRGGTVGAAGKG